MQNAGMLFKLRIITFQMTSKLYILCIENSIENLCLFLCIFIKHFCQTIFLSLVNLCLSVYHLFVCLSFCLLSSAYIAVYEEFGFAEITLLTQIFSTNAWTRMKTFYLYFMAGLKGHSTDFFSYTYVIPKER